VYITALECTDIERTRLSLRDESLQRQRIDAEETIVIPLVGLLSSSFNCPRLFIVRVRARRDIVLTRRSRPPVIAGEERLSARDQPETRKRPRGTLLFPPIVFALPPLPSLPARRQSRFRLDL